MTTHNTGNPVPSAAVKDLYDNAENLDKGINGDAPTWVDRKGQVRKSMAGVEQDFAKFLADGSTIEFASWAEANIAVGNGQIPLNRQVAVVGDYGTHTDPVTGEVVPNSGRYIMTVVGLQFRSADVLSEKADKTVVEPLVPVVTRLDTAYPQDFFQTFAYTWTCPHPTVAAAKLVAGGIEQSGRLNFAAGRFAELEVDRLDATLPGYPRTALPGFSHNVFDGNDAAAGGVSTDGVLTYDAARLRTLNGYKVDRLVYGPRATFDAELPMLLNYGQSLAAGPVGAITTAQEYDSVCFPAHSTSPATFSPATAANGSEGGNREIPSFGSCAMTKSLILSEDGIAFNQQKYQLLIGNAAYGGYSISQLEKGTAPYAELIGQVQAGYGIAQAAGRRFVVSAMNWVHGPGNFNSGYRYYLTRQIKLADDIDADCRSITKQGRPVYTIVSQSASQGAAFKRPVPLAQLEASLRSDKIILAAPEYMFTYLPDGMQVHITPASTRIMGAYLGLAYKRTIVDGKKWEPLRPEKIDVQGRVIYVRFNRSGLIFDTTLVPAQVQRGFSLLDTLGNDNPLSSIEVVQPDTVRMVAASMPKPGSVLWLGGATATGIANYAGGASNLRDSQGDTISFDGYPLHNWAAVFAAKIN